MLAYHSDPAVKTAILAQIAAHRAADEIVKGRYWEHGKGCGVGCTIHSGDHAAYETRFGIPQALAYIEDKIFEGLPDALATTWPERFMGAIPVGADLSRVSWRFLHWLLTDEAVNPGINHPLVAEAVGRCAALMGALAEGRSVDLAEIKSARSAVSAASAAWKAARSARNAARSAESAWSAARSAESAAWSAAWSAAENGARSAESARNAAWSAARSAVWSAQSAAWSAAENAENAESAWSAADSAARSARSAAYVLMSERLLALLGEDGA